MSIIRRLQFDNLHLIMKLVIIFCLFVALIEARERNYRNRHDQENRANNKNNNQNRNRYEVSVYKNN